jgi:hypothetical protein
MTYKLWIPDDNLGVLKHIENLGGAYRRESDNIYMVANISAGKLRDIKGVFCLSHPRSAFEAAYLKGVATRFGR